MTIMLDQETLVADLGAKSTLGDALLWVNGQIHASGKVIVKIELDGTVLEGQTLSDSHGLPIENRNLGISTADQTELSHAMIGKLAALVEYLGRQHHAVAQLLEKGQTGKALEQLAGVLSAWQQIQQAFTGLTKMIKLDLDTLLVGEIPAAEVVGEFRRQLQEIHTALTNQDMVLLGDVLQYEMDSAVTNWNDLLATVLGVVDGVI